MLLHDVFICHASEDKDEFVRPLAEALRSHHIEVWYDEFALNVGDSLRETIDRGLSASRFGIVVLSPHFFQKRWPNRELNGLVAREANEDRHLILPVWHNVNSADILRFSPPLADLLAASSADGLDQVVDDLLRKIRPAESPLIVARDFLIKKGVVPPVITDEWWLDIIEIKEAELAWPDLNHDWRWIFPLPFPAGVHGKERGLNIAWAALQVDWAEDAKQRQISQLTHPDDVHDFMEKWPGLQDCARSNPEILALYAPQLTIKGLDDGYADIFDQLLSPAYFDKCDAFRYGRPQTIDGGEPSCGDFIAWRHPTFGNYTAGELSYQFATAHNGLYSRKVFGAFECLVWLLSDDSQWMPEKLRQTLMYGFRERTHWWMHEFGGNNDVIANALFHKTSSTFAYTRNLKSALQDEVERAAHALHINCNAVEIISRFTKAAYFEAYHTEMKRLRQSRKAR